MEKNISNNFNIGFKNVNNNFTNGKSSTGKKLYITNPKYIYDGIALPQGPVTGNLTLNGPEANKQIDGTILIESNNYDGDVTFRVTGTRYDDRSQVEDIIGPGDIVAGPYNGLVLFLTQIREILFIHILLIKILLHWIMKLII